MLGQHNSLPPALFGVDREGELYVLYLFQVKLLKWGFKSSVGAIAFLQTLPWK
ncbi:MAG TPA: hypothetical protein V6D31_01630 [Candidatus Sericytochromatia bacterium]|jgi:hypothetical protein